MLTVFNHGQQPAPATWNLGRTVSAAIHAAVLLAVFFRFGPVIIQPSLVKLGDRGTGSLVYLAPKSPNATVAAARLRIARASLQAPAPAPAAKQPIEDQPPQKEVQSPETQTSRASAAGSPYGAVYEGSSSGPDVRPAIPTVFPDPPIARWEIPPGVQGDVIVEITIDAQGVVTETRLLKSLGYGLEERIMATLRNWRFRPATRDGDPIPSKQDVHFHYPG